MFAVLSVLIIIAVSILSTRVATVALMHTGLLGDGLLARLDAGVAQMWQDLGPALPGHDGIQDGQPP